MCPRGKYQKASADEDSAKSSAIKYFLFDFSGIKTERLTNIED
jgi:hypothetical protein